MGHRFMGIAERQAFFDQVVGQIGCGGIALQCRIAHGFRFDADAGGHVGENTQGVDDGVDGIEQRFLVFLVVFVIGQRLAFHEREQGDQMAVDAPGFAARQFRHVRIFLLRHDGRAGAEAVGDIDEADARTHPDHQFFGHARNMRHDQCGSSAKFDGEIAVRYGVERIGAYAFESQRARDPFPVDGKGGAGQRRSAQRQPVDAFSAVGHAFRVASEHLHVSQHVVAESDRLGDLHVGETRHDGVGMLFRQIQQSQAELVQQSGDVVDCAAQVQANIRGDLVVARASGMQSLAGIADDFGQAFFNIQVHVFQIQLPVEVIRADLGGNLCHAAHNFGIICLADDFLKAQHFSMRQRALDIDLGQAFVKEYRCGIAFYQIGYRFREACRPGLVFFGKLGSHITSLRVFKNNGMIIKHLKLVTLANTPSAVSSVIPDCCNVGVIYRVLVLSNVAVFGAIWMLSPTLTAAGLVFFGLSMLLETICIVSLLVLCGLRKVALVQHMPVWLQRLLCGIAPALVALGCSVLLLYAPWLLGDFVPVSAWRMCLLSAVSGMLFQHYFELRSRTFSPALGEAKLRALQARIRPHFLFNSMNAVLSLIRTEPQRAEAALEDLADLFRVLMRDTRDVSTLADELQLCHQYLSIEKIRLGERLKVEWEIGNLSEQDIRQVQIASLLLQPLIENAVHHGVEPSTGPALISIKLLRQVDHLFITVENPYFPSHTSKGNHMALDNIQERLRLMYDVEADFVAAVAGTQFQVRMRFPFQKITGPGNERQSGEERRSVNRTV